MEDREILARTIYGEARGEGSIGMLAVGCVVMNRVNHPRYYSDTDGDKIPTIHEVCLYPYAFSCWNINDPNRDKLIQVTEDDKYFALALQIADRIIEGNYQDITNGATFYYVRGSKKPKWANEPTARISAEIGQHIFYTGVY
jgi:spore germination cell wall hydrolase CwlJ-like protein